MGIMNSMYLFISKLSAFLSNSTKLDEKEMCVCVWGQARYLHYLWWNPLSVRIPGLFSLNMENNGFDFVLIFRTKRNFAANLKIIINVNKALTKILSEMRSK